MKPVKQTIIYNENTLGNGDCLTACYASLLEIPIWMVPQFHMMYGRPDFNSRIHQWFKFLNLELIQIYHIDEPSFLEDDETAHLANLPEWYIACGPSVRGTGHAVIYSDGKLVHDPHSSDAGITKVRRVEFIRPLLKS